MDEQYEAPRGLQRDALQTFLITPSIERRKVRFVLTRTNRASEPPTEYLPERHEKELSLTNIYEPESYDNAVENSKPAVTDLLPDDLTRYWRKLKGFPEVMYGTVKL